MDPGSTARRAVVLIAAFAALGATAMSPATADSSPDPHPQRPTEVLRPIAPPPAGSSADSTESNRATADPDGIEIARTSRPVAPGLRLTSYDRLEPGRWLRVDTLTVDLHRGDVTADYLSSARVTDRDTLSRLAAHHDPGVGRRTAAAVNADFFDINQTGAPQGPGIRDGRITHSPVLGTHRAVGIGPGGVGRVLQLYFDGTLTLPTGNHPLTAYNAADVPAQGIGAYTASWGDADRALTVERATAVAEVVVRDGKVISIAARPGQGPIASGSTVLVGREVGARTLAALRPGDPVSWTYRPRTDGGPVPRTAVGGRELLVVDGVPQNHEGRPNNTAAPRTAVGFSHDGRTMQIITIDGRQADSAGVTLTELGRMLQRAGAHNALNLDGGGSSTLLARPVGGDELRVENSPSDGSERTVPNGLALTAPDGSGTLRGYRLSPRMAAAQAPTADPVAGGHPDRVFPGLSRRLDAAGHDETFGPAAGTPRWRSLHPAIGQVDADGVFRAHHSGRVRVRAERAGAQGSVDLTVLGALARIEPTTRRVSLADPAAFGGFGIIGFDAQGNSAPVEPADVALHYDRGLFDVRAGDNGRFVVTSRTGGGAGRITATVDGVTTVLAVGVGHTAQSVAEFDDAGTWTFSQARARGAVAPTPDGRDGTGLQLTYDFTGSTATRAAYANPPRPIEVPGQPQSFTLWIKGDAQGAWPTLHLKDATGSDQLLRGPHITWTGWRQVSFPVPQQAATPLSVHRFYLAETAAARQYRGQLAIDGLTAQVPPAVELPARPRVTDPLIDTAAGTQGRDWRFAVMSDAQFVARDPASPIVSQARRTLREIKSAHPDFLIINGDLVDEGSPQDLAFARKILTEELGADVPWHYVPGNHEVMGGRIDDFIAEFGPAHRSFDHRGTRFLTLDTSSLSLRGGGFSQIREVHQQLAAAAKDPGVGAVVVVQHVPPRDPTPQRASQLGDRKEAALIEDWLADFRRRTGKGAALIGSHVGVFHAERVNGVPYLINGNSGKTPAGPVDEGGFTGWSLVGVDRVSQRERLTARRRPWTSGPDWLSVQIRAHVDSLTIDAPAALPPGASGEARATAAQGTRRTPVAYPMSADWTGSPGLHIGKAGDARPRHLATFDPTTGRLTALRPGNVDLAVTVNGVTAHAEVRVAAQSAGSGRAAPGAPMETESVVAQRPAPAGPPGLTHPPGEPTHWVACRSPRTSRGGLPRKPLVPAIASS
ncbi:phosphodiester glycosidase family protein [Streptomyces albipurpureus]|uniref:Phosphodiester glycosidase family protein n=1 Tax=Streptomyces albipurpureus TaxID=2897419 RepID=A0ABT0UPU3_9ACTN|nr:phosphodiester glycosidase family protein [Streptomyces sp. CWNU-1]MCM2390637.1 phosphodiester glycosidase family protein [Streptomyces sp. CWNU-1]